MAAGDEKSADFWWEGFWAWQRACGFEVTGTLQAGASPPMFAMVRPPR